MTLAFLESLSNTEVIIIGIVGIMLFGKDLPEMMRKFGKKVTDIKRNVSALQGDLKSAAGSFQNEIGDSMRSVTDSMRSLDSTVKQAGDAMQESVDGTTPKKKKSSFSNDSDRDEPVAKKFAPPEEDALDAAADAAEATSAMSDESKDGRPNEENSKNSEDTANKSSAKSEGIAKSADSTTIDASTSTGSTDS